MSPNLDTSASIIEEGDMNRFCCQVMNCEYLGPFDETDIFLIVEDISSTDTVEILENIESIEIEMIDILSIFLIVCIGWTAYNHIPIGIESSEYRAYERSFSSTEISDKKNPISSLEIERDIIEFLFSKDRIDVKG